MTFYNFLYNVLTCLLLDLFFLIFIAIVDVIYFSATFF